MITETGKSISVLILTEPGKDWEAFATWYSCYKNLPDAQVAIACLRNGDTPFHLFQWVKRVKVPLFFHNPLTKDDPVANRLDVLQHAYQKSLFGENLLLIPHLTMAIDVFDKKTLELMNAKKMWISDDIWFLKNPNLDEIQNSHYLESNAWHGYLPEERAEGPISVEAKEQGELACLVTYQKGCGKWLNTSKGCPFSSAAGLASTEMTVNENRIIELWKRMCTLYNAVI